MVCSFFNMCPFSGVRFFLSTIVTNQIPSDSNMSESKEEHGRPARTWGPNTLNNYTDADVEMIQSWAPDVTRLLLSKEIGEEGTPHLQFSMTFKTVKRLSSLKKLCSRVHWEIARVDSDVYLYCKKDGSQVVCNIDNRTQGKRRDVDAAYDAVINKRTRAQFYQERPSYQAIRVYEKVSVDMHEPEGWSPKTVEWFYGATGTGKTRAAWERYGESLYVVTNVRWFDGYIGQETILIDDHRAADVAWGELLRLLDSYPLRREVKGGHVWLAHRRVVITAPCTFEEMYSYQSPTELSQLARRITRVEQFGAVAVPVPAAPAAAMGNGGGEPEELGYGWDHEEIPYRAGGPNISIVDLVADLADADDGVDDFDE